MDRPDVADIEAAASGDTAAFERLVRTLQGPLWRYLVHLVRDHSQAEDLTQEVLLRVHRKIDTLRDPDRFIPWLWTMARNAAYDSGRAKVRRPLELVPDPDQAGRRQSEDPHLEVEVYEALESLDPALREAVVMVGIVGMTYAEAADVADIPEGTMKSRVFRARKELMEKLR